MNSAFSVKYLTKLSYVASSVLLELGNLPWHSTDHISKLKSQKIFRFTFYVVLLLDLTTRMAK